MANGLKEGDIVSFLDDVGGGSVLAVQESGLVLVLTDDGFRLELLASNLVLREPAMESDLLKVSTQEALEKMHADRPSSSKVRANYENPRGKKSRREKDSEGVVEIDLHLHQIMENDRGLSSGEKLGYQLRYFERMLSGAIQNKKRKMIVIHGVGEGRLRDEVHNILKYYSGVRYRDADPRRFGSGATEIEILQY